MDFDFKMFEQLQEFKLKNSLDDVPTLSNHFFVYKNKVVLMKQSRNKYTVYCSPQCHQVALVPMRVFDICFQSKNYADALNFFNKVVFDIISYQTRSLFV